MGKNVGAVFAALVSVVFVTVICEVVDVWVYPVDGALVYIVNLPRGAKLLIVASWALTAFAGAMTALVLGERPWLAFAGAGWTLVAICLSLRAETYPWWMTIAGLAAPPLMAVAAIGVWRLAVAR